MADLKLKINVQNIEAAAKAFDELRVAAENAEKALEKLKNFTFEDEAPVVVGPAYMS